MTDFNIQISTENGTGSMTANKILLRCLISEGLHATAKNLFPSNIAGLPTTFKIRVSDYRQTSTTNRTDLYIGFNKKTLDKDLSTLMKDTFCVFNADFKFESDLKSEFTNQLSVECRKSVRELHDSASTKKLLYNMLYVGTSLKLTGCSLENAVNIAKDYFRNLKEDVREANLLALKKGFELVEASFFELSRNVPETTCLFEGNNCSALGFLDGGATVATWYPITPSSSVAETFEKLSKDFKFENRSILQCEDEISSAVAALGAGWSGARSFSATSGPGLSLMQEAVGLGYFTESPFVILDVQRAGPSTGLPTRTAQGDLLLAHYSSHGDTLHPVLLPGTPQEAYDDSFDSLNLAQSINSPVFILSDLDLGMNEWSSKPIVQKEAPLDQGPIQKETTNEFKRFSNESSSPKRSIPRISDAEFSYFTRGSGHAEDGTYSEDKDVYEKKLIRLKDKILDSKNKSTHYPKDVVEHSDSEVCIVTWGSSGQIIEELKDLLPFKFSHMRIRSLPLSKDQFDFFKDHKINYVIDQNRDGQMNHIIKATCPDESFVKTKSICHFNGQPINPKKIALDILEAYNGRN